MHLPGAGRFARQLKQGQRVISREIRNAPEEAVGESLPSTPCSRGRSGYPGTPPTALSSPSCCVLCPSPLHAQGQKFVFQCVAPAGTCLTIFQSLAFQHQANSTVLAFLPHGTPRSCLFPHGAQLAAVLRGKPHIDFYVLCSFPGECVLMAENKFYHSAKFTRCLAPRTCKCSLQCLKPVSEKVSYNLFAPMFPLACILHVQNHGHTSSFLFAARLKLVSCSLLEL